MIFKELNGVKDQTCNAPVQLLDIYPTLTDLCQLPDYKLAEGHSLTPFLKNTKSKASYPSLSYYGVGNVAVRNERFRLMQYEDGSIEFYDMKEDPNEWKNLANDKKQQEEINKMKAFIPKSWAPLSEFSTFDVNTYFKEKTGEK